MAKGTGKEDTRNPLDVRTVREMPPHSHVVSVDEGRTVTVSPMPDGAALLAKAKTFELSMELTIRLQEANTSIAKLIRQDGDVEVLKIDDQNQEAEVRLLINHYKEYLTQIEEERKAAKEDILKAAKLIDGKAAVHSSAAEAAKGKLDRALKAYVQQEEEKARKKQEQLQREHDAKVAKEQKRAEAKGVEMRPVAPAPVVQAPQKTTTVVVGGMAIKQTWVDNWKWRLIGVSDAERGLLTADRAAEFGLPLNYFRLDCGIVDKLAKAVKAEVVLAGSKIQGYNDRYLK